MQIRNSITQDMIERRKWAKCVITLLSMQHHWAKSIYNLFRLYYNQCHFILFLYCVLFSRHLNFIFVNDISSESYVYSHTWIQSQQEFLHNSSSTFNLSKFDIIQQTVTIVKEKRANKKMSNESTWVMANQINHHFNASNRVCRQKAK